MNRPRGDNLRESYRIALERRGWVRDREVRSKKFWVMRHPENDKAYYLGKGGALRLGSTIDTSYPASDAFKAALLKEAKQ